MPPRIKPGGVGQYFTCDGMTEVSTSTCSHCSHVTDIPDRKRMFDMVDVCRQCMRLICLGCVGKPCTPWLKKLDMKEDEFYRRRQLSKALGLE